MGLHIGNLSEVLIFVDKKVCSNIKNITPVYI